MKNFKRHIAALAVITCSFVACKKYDNPAGGNIKANVYKELGTSDDLTAVLTSFRNAIGSTLNTAPGAEGGRREINWDGVPDGFTNNNLFPGNFFAQIDSLLPNGRKRGATFLNFDGFRISNNNFADIEPSYEVEFAAFSPSRTFMPVHSNFTEVQFKVPGTNTKAFVESFGVIFSDVDKAGAASIELFDEKGESLGVFAAKAQTGSGKFSFLGVHVPGVKITKVVIKSGETPLGDKDISAGGIYDAVIMDDFIYDEPKKLN
jgi:hypothetical protein